MTIPTHTPFMHYALHLLIYALHCFSLLLDLIRYMVEASKHDIGIGLELSGWIRVQNACIHGAQAFLVEKLHFVVLYPRPGFLCSLVPSDERSDWWIKKEEAIAFLRGDLELFVCEGLGDLI